MEKGVESYLDISQMRLFAEGNWEYEQEPRMIREDGSIKEVWTERQSFSMGTWTERSGTKAGGKLHDAWKVLHFPTSCVFG